MYLQEIYTHIIKVIRSNLQIVIYMYKYICECFNYKSKYIITIEMLLEVH